MIDFSNLKKYQVDAESRAWFTLSRIEGEPRLLVGPATQENPVYYNAVLLWGMENAVQLRVGRTSVSTLAANREIDRELYPLHVVFGWDRVVDAKGEVVPFSVENVREYLAALPDYIFDDVRAFAGNQFNFPGTANVVVAEAVGGNSLGG